MKIINILFCIFFLLLNSCNSDNNDTFNKNNKNNTRQAKSRGKRDLDTKESQQEKITLTDEESKMFNSLVTTFKYTIEKLTNQIQGCNNGNKSKCTGFFDWLSTDTEKQKELADAFKKVYDFLETKRKAKANNEDFNTYIKGGIDCKIAKDNANNQNGNNANQNDCDKDNKYGSGGTNEIEQYFRGVAGDIFNKNSNEEIYQCLKEELLDEDDHFDSLENWNN